MKKFAVILSGCGKLDGSEIHEATLTLLNIDLNGGQYQCASIDRNQYRVMDHAKNVELVNEKRNMLVESARIARCEIVDISKIKASDYDALVLPGGFGAALNLCDFGINGENTKVCKEVEELILEFHKAKKPIGAICIAPVLVAKVLAPYKVKVTIGNDAQTASIINKWGAEHVNCLADEICFDPTNLVVTTPAYMLAKTIGEVHRGIEKLIKKMISI